MNKLEKVLYTGYATSTGGRDGRSVSSDGKLDLKLSPPEEMGGKGDGVNPEQLFAVGYSSCFLGAIKLVAGKENVTVPKDARITGAIGVGPIASGGLSIQVELQIDLPGMDKAVAEDIVAKAHKVCPYSNATRGNIDVQLKVSV